MHDQYSSFLFWWQLSFDPFLYNQLHQRHFQHHHDWIRANIIINTIYIRIIKIMIIITMMTIENRRFWRTSPQPLHEDQDQDWGPGKRWKWWSNVQIQNDPFRHHDELFRWWQNYSSCGAVQKKQEEEEERVRKEIKEYEQVKREILANKMKIRGRKVKMRVTGWQNLADFRQGRRWPWKLSSSAYLHFSRHMRRFCA